MANALNSLNLVLPILSLPPTPYNTGYSTIDDMTTSSFLQLGWPKTNHVLIIELYNMNTLWTCRYSHVHHSGAVHWTPAAQLLQWRPQYNNYTGMIMVHCCTESNDANTITMDSMSTQQTWQYSKEHHSGAVYLIPAAQSHIFNNSISNYRESFICYPNLMS